jgi:stage II sporulation protein R
MKKVVCCLVCLGLLLSIFYTGLDVKGSSSMQDQLAEKLIRFHVIANSDTVEDQALKLKVRDKVLEYISPKLKNSKSIEESRDIIKANDENIKKIVQEVIKKNGYKYDVSTKLSRENFPVKTYGNITLPQGEYEAYRILIGNASGQNWWCVMFPPLCFVDITKGEVSRKETEKTMKKVLSEEEYKYVDNTESKKEPGKEDNQIIIKFKVVEVFNKLFKK